MTFSATFISHAMPAVHWHTPKMYIIGDHIQKYFAFSLLLLLFSTLHEVIFLSLVMP